MLCLDRLLLTTCVRGIDHEGDHRSAFGATWPRSEHPLPAPEVEAEDRERDQDVKDYLAWYRDATRP